MLTIGTWGFLMVRVILFVLVISLKALFSHTILYFRFVDPNVANDEKNE